MLHFVVGFLTMISILNFQIFLTNFHLVKDILSHYYQYKVKDLIHNYQKQILYFEKYHKI